MRKCYIWIWKKIRLSDLFSNFEKPITSTSKWQRPSFLLCSQPPQFQTGNFSIFVKKKLQSECFDVVASDLFKNTHQQLFQCFRISHDSLFHFLLFSIHFLVFFILLIFLAGELSTAKIWDAWKLSARFNLNFSEQTETFTIPAPVQVPTGDD